MFHKADPSVVLARLKDRVQRVNGNEEFQHVAERKTKPRIAIIEKDDFKPLGLPKKQPAKHEYRGKLYTVAELAKLPECKVNTHTLRQRLLHRSVEDAVNQPKIEHFVSNITPPERYEYCSESLTLLQLCKRAGVSKRMIYDRMKRGLTVDEALATSTQHGNEGYVVEFKWRDQVYTIREYCKVTGIPISRAIIEVVNNGLTGDQCAELINKRYIHYEFEGELYTVKQLAEKVGCSPTMLRYRVDVLKWPVAKAVEYGRWAR